MNIRAYIYTHVYMYEMEKKVVDCPTRHVLLMFYFMPGEDPEALGWQWQYFMP